MTRLVSRWSGAILLASLVALPARAVILYDGSLNTPPDVQGWIFGKNPIFGNSATETASGGVTTLDTTAVTNDQAGYFSQLPPFPSLSGMPVLDRTTGYTIRFDVRLVAESHNQPDRAGFDVIVLGNDNRGIEIALWQDYVFVLNDDVPTFSHGEETPFDTTVAVTRFELCVLGNEYVLGANGNQVLTGALRDYSSFGPPYTWTSFLFLGDDTTSASARTDLALVEATAATTPGFSCRTPGCAVPPAVVQGVRAVRIGSDVKLSWEPGAGAVGYNVWYVSSETDIDGARLNSPPASGVQRCSEPLPVGVNECTDSLGVPRNSPSAVYYQVRVACDPSTEGP